MPIVPGNIWLFWVGVRIRRDTDNTILYIHIYNWLFGWYYALVIFVAKPSDVSNDSFARKRMKSIVDDVLIMREVSMCKANGKNWMTWIKRTKSNCSTFSSDKKSVLLLRFLLLMLMLLLRNRKSQIKMIQEQWLHHWHWSERSNRCEKSNWKYSSDWR